MTVAVSAALTALAFGFGYYLRLGELRRVRRVLKRIGCDVKEIVHTNGGGWRLSDVAGPDGYVLVYSKDGRLIALEKTLLTALHEYAEEGLR